MSKQSRRESRRNRASREERLEAERQSGVPHGKPRGGRLSKRLPMNMGEVRQLLSTREDKPNYLRHPIGRKENRYWDKLWSYKGRGFTKPPYKGDSKRRKQRQEKQSRKWRLKRERNNKKKEVA